MNEKELTGDTRRMFKAGKKSLHEYINVDSDIEREFAKDLEMQEEVKLYTKLPNWFKIPTPLGNYNPDWALVINKNGEDNIYFVVETKSNLLTLRDNESGKIKCGEAHFESLTPLNENPAKYACAIKYEYLNSLE